MNRPSALRNSEDMLLWNLLTLSGIRVPSANYTMQKTSTVVTVFLLLSAFYAVCLNIVGLIAAFEKLFLLYLTYYFLSIFLWWSLCRERKATAGLFRLIHKIRNLFNISNKKSSLIINVALSVIYMLIITAYITTLYWMKKTGTRTRYFTFNCEVESKLLRDVLVGCGLFCSNTLLFYIPCMMIITFSALEYRLSEILASYNDRLKRILENSSTDNPTCMIKLFFILADICEGLKNILSLPLFLLIASSFTGLLVALSNMIPQKSSAVNAVDTVLLTSVTCMAILSQGTFGYLIPEKLLAISKTAGKIVEKYDKRPKKENNHLFYFKRMAKREITYLTASDMFRFDRGFVLHAFGAILTYGLLIINLK